jgi:hypothetical protein
MPNEEVGVSEEPDEVAPNVNGDTPMPPALGTDGKPIPMGADGNEPKEFSTFPSAPMEGSEDIEEFEPVEEDEVDFVRAAPALNMPPTPPPPPKPNDGADPVPEDVMLNGGGGRGTTGAESWLVESLSCPMSMVLLGESVP